MIDERGEAAKNSGQQLYDSLVKIAVDAGDNLDRAGEYTSSKIHHALKLLDNIFILSYDQGKQVQEILNRYIGEELQPMIDNDELDDDSQADVQKDINYITGLAKLFD